ncbi:hypothetical protein GCM10010435_08340 [Winogradskya consettensis]|uniref:Serine protease n=1 Tax=Winogradskya consettensis TaxID=113560 RepID=A0A919W5F6_9ACTN|nr:S8 family peptidase [Actinoplanes consettensis]GIM80503.1 hypothetical protein Aco04nite_71060 [Actinoplanes consettensis]
MPTSVRITVAAAVAVALSAVAVPTSAGAAPVGRAVVAVAPDADVVPDSYVILLEQAGTAVKTQATALVKKHGGKVRQTYSHAVRGFAATMTAEQAAKLAADPAVTAVQPNIVHHASTTQTDPPSYGLDRIDQRTRPLSATYTYTTSASNVHAYIIDTGIRATHADFGGRATSGFDAIDGDAADDCNGHGTHVAGTVGGSAFGVAKGVQLVAVRVLDCEGSGTTAQVVAGIDWVSANAVTPAVANMSLGGGPDPALDAAVSRSIAGGVSYAIAAGNGGPLGILPLDACIQSPARVPAALTVSAVDSTDHKPSWANRGTCVDVFAPGVNITSAWITDNNATTTISGTSMAAPHVAGAAALYLATHTAATPAEVHAAIVSAATPDVVTGPGLGTPNRLLYTGTF